MTEKTKTTGSRYSEAQTTELVQAYTAVDSQELRESVVVEFTNKFGFPPASIRGKLSSEGVYVPKVRTTKSGAAIVRKSELVAQVAQLMGKDEEAVESLEKVTKPVLNMLIETLTK